MTSNEFFLLSLVAGLVVAVLLDFARTKGEAFAATTATIVMTWLWVTMVWVFVVRGPELSGVTGVMVVFGLFWATIRVWQDLFRRFPPGGSRA